MTFNRPTRVVHVVPTIENGGAEQQLLALCKAADPERWDMRVICTHGYGSLQDAYEKAGVQLDVVGKRSSVDPTLVTRLAKIIETHDPDIVHTWLFQANLWGRLAASLLPQKPVVIASERSVDVLVPSWIHPLDMVLSRLSDVMIGNSGAVADFLRNRKRIPGDRIYAIPNGVDLARAQRCLTWSENELASYRRKRGISQDAFVVAHIGQPIPHKRFDILANVIGNVNRAGVPVQLLQLGRDASTPAEESYLSAFHAKLIELGISDHVHRTGFVQEVSPELAIADALLHTSDIEGFPNAVIEAMAMDRPVIATAAGGTSDVVQHQRTGWLTRTGDVDGLTTGVLHAFKHREETQRWANAGRELIERDYSVNSLVRNTTNLYRTLLRKHGKTCPPE
jgi:glycosyltransferase involved in cell wall biosynthesis